MVEVSTSVLNLSEEDYIHSFYNLESAKTDYFHIDVMDGKFVKNDTSKRMKEYAMALSHISQLGLDVHLMVEDVEKYIDSYVELEPRIITFHIEAVKDKQRVLDIIEDLKRNNIRVGIAIKPETSIDSIKEYLHLIHLVLVMTVEPGEGGQGFIYATLEKVRELRKYIYENDIDIDIEVDGGINNRTAKQAVEAGANILVSGTYILNHEDPKYAISSLREL